MSTVTTSSIPAGPPGPRSGTTGTHIAAVAEQERRAPGRPRSARAERAILGAVLDLLAEGTSVDLISIEAVAARAGVGKATIYRRWANKEALLMDAVAAMKGPLPEIAGESVRDDLVTLLRPASQSEASATQASHILGCLIPELKRNPGLYGCYQRVIEPRRKLMLDVLRRGIAAGELRADLDLEITMAMLVGPMLVQSVFDWSPWLDREAMPERLVDALWPAIAAPADS